MAIALKQVSEPPVPPRQHQPGDPAGPRRRRAQGSRRRTRRTATRTQRSSCARSTRRRPTPARAAPPSTRGGRGSRARGGQRGAASGSRSRSSRFSIIAGIVFALTRLGAGPGALGDRHRTARPRPTSSKAPASKWSPRTSRAATSRTRSPRPTRPRATARTRAPKSRSASRSACEVAIPSKGVIDAPAAEATKKLQDENLQVESEEVNSNGVEAGQRRRDRAGDRREGRMRVGRDDPDLEGREALDGARRGRAHRRLRPDTAIEDAGLDPERRRGGLRPARGPGDQRRPPAADSEVKKDTGRAHRLERRGDRERSERRRPARGHRDQSTLREPRRDERRRSMEQETDDESHGRARDRPGAFRRHADPRDATRSRSTSACSSSRWSPIPTTTGDIDETPTREGAAPMKVAVLSGGRSSEHDVSLRSGESVAAGLEEAGHEVVRVLIERDGRWLAGSEEVELRAAAACLAPTSPSPCSTAPSARTAPSRGSSSASTSRMPGRACSRQRSRWTSSSASGFSRITASRRCTSARWASRAGASTAAAMGMPIWVKPSRLGSSVGITTRHVGRAGARRGRRAGASPRPARDRRGALRGARGRVLGDRQHRAESPRCRARSSTQGAEWYDFEAKYTDGGMRLAVPAPIGDDGCGACPRAGGRGLTRRSTAAVSPVATSSSTEGGEVLVNEINTIPGFTETSVFGKLFEATRRAVPRAVRPLGEACGRTSHSRARLRVLVSGVRAKRTKGEPRCP